MLVPILPKARKLHALNPGKVALILVPVVKQAQAFAHDSRNLRALRPRQCQRLSNLCPGTIAPSCSRRLQL